MLDPSCAANFWRVRHSQNPRNLHPQNLPAERLRLLVPLRGCRSLEGNHSTKAAARFVRFIEAGVSCLLRIIQTDRYLPRRQAWPQCSTHALVRSNDRRTRHGANRSRSQQRRQRGHTNCLTRASAKNEKRHTNARLGSFRREGSFPKGASPRMASLNQSRLPPMKTHRRQPLHASRFT